MEKPNRKIGKIFGIGLSRTGTTSLSQALNILGFKSVHYPFDNDTYQKLVSGRYDLKILETHDAITDIVAAPFYAQLDKQYPGSKFVLTVRDEQSWLRSFENYSIGLNRFKSPLYRILTAERRREYKMFLFINSAVYGTVWFNPERMLHAYRLHTKNVLDYFHGKNNLLVMDITKAEGWSALCPFLEVPVPGEPFPNLNAKN